MRLTTRNSAPPIGDEALSVAEGRLGITLPDDYRTFLLMHNGGTPRPCWFRLRVPAGRLPAPHFRGSLRWLGQKYGNDSIRERRRDWHRVSSLFAVAAGSEDASAPPDLERAYRDRPRGLPAHLAPIASVQGFDADGLLCLDLSPEGRGHVLYWPDVEGLEPVPVAGSFDALLEILGYPGRMLPEWLALVYDGDLDGLRHYLNGSKSRLRENDEWGWTSLDHAVFDGRWEIVDFLLQARDVSPGMVLYDALVDGRFPTARGMLRYEIDAELIAGSLARKAEVFWTDPEMVQAFLDAGADPNFIDDIASDGDSPLHYAAQAGALESVLLLLARGADPTAENESGERPRDRAARFGHDRLVEALDEAEAARPPAPRLEDETEAIDLHAVSLKGSPGGLGEEALAAFETRLGIRLPGEYRAFLRQFNGGVPRPARFRLKGDDGSGMKCEVTRFLAVGAGPSFGEDIDVETVRDRLYDWGLPRRMLPIASVEDEIEGGTLCISLRGEDRGRVVYYAPTDGGDSTTHTVAKSLSGFFKGLGRRKDTSPAWVRAIEDDNPEAFQAWLDGGGTLRKRHRGRGPLVIAVAEGKLRVVRWLLDQGAKPETAFRLAMEAGQPEVLLDLLHLDGFRPAVPASALAGFFLTERIWRSAELVGRLIDLGADVNAVAGPGMTPLMIAAQHGTPEVLRLLLDRGARAGVWSAQGEMALHRAVCSISRDEMLEKMRLLIDVGEALDAQAPRSALPGHVLDTARALETPLADLLRQAGPQESVFGKLLESLASDPQAPPAMGAGIPAGHTYFGQFQRTAAEFLIEHRGDPAALAELERHAQGNR